MLGGGRAGIRFPASAALDRGTSPGRTSNVSYWAAVGQKQKIMIDRFVRVQCGLRTDLLRSPRLSHSEYHDALIEAGRLKAGVRGGALRVEGR